MFTYLILLGIGDFSFYFKRHLLLNMFNLKQQNIIKKYLSLWNLFKFISFLCKSLFNDKLNFNTYIHTLVFSEKKIYSYIFLSKQILERVCRQTDADTLLVACFYQMN